MRLFFIMKKIDPKLTGRIQEWLNTPEKERDIDAGATMLLQLTNNHALYNSVMRAPAKFAAKMTYELRKYLKIRLDHMTMADVVRLENEVMPKAAETVGKTVISTDDEITEAEAAGRRADHDQLPPEIQALWDDNGPRIRKIIQLFNELKNMYDQRPCDRYEKVKMLGELDKIYRANLEKYDAYVPGTADATAGTPTVEPSADPEAPETTVDIAAKVGNARKNLSKYRKQISELADEDPKRPKLIMKMQKTVDFVLTSGGTFSADTMTDLRTLGISFGE